MKTQWWYYHCNYHYMYITVTYILSTLFSYNKLPQSNSNTYLVGDWCGTAFTLTTSLPLLVNTYCGPLFHTLMILSLQLPLHVYNRDIYTIYSRILPASSAPICYEPNLKLYINNIPNATPNMKTPHMYITVYWSAYIPVYNSI